MDETKIPASEALKSAVAAIKNELAEAEARVAALKAALARVAALKAALAQAAPEMRALGLFDADVTAPKIDGRTKAARAAKTPHERRYSAPDTTLADQTAILPQPPMDNDHVAPGCERFEEAAE